MLFRILGIAFIGIFISSCKAGKPELTLLNGLSKKPVVGGSSPASGRLTSGSQTNLGTTSQYKVRSRVSLVPSQFEGTTSNYKVRGHVQL